MLEETTLNSEYVKVSLSEEGDKGVGTILSAYEKYNNYKIEGTKEGRKIKSGKLKPNEEKKYELRIWLDEKVTKEDEVEGSTYKSKIVVESVIGEKPYTESVLHGTDPVLDGEYNTNYFNKVSVVASTTKNYTGIYDMSGGAFEYMMSGLDDNSTGDGKTGKLSSGRHNVYNSGFKGKLTCPNCNDNGVEVNHDISEVTEGIALPKDERYYDKYEYGTSSTTYNRGFLGDATKEMGPFQTMQYGTQSKQVGSWYNDEIWIVISGAPWIGRGGGYTAGTGAGLFNFTHVYGHAAGHVSFRLVLAF